ncbi:hypothetical protein [Pyxidicoccus sp. MSG2]|uniref:hypothetical protein n=1 Tax=Pyxidicoccus sp. MSG2 TaxID=2996790 RepID=UPI00226E3C40|nr:hypothetical protein [Pyxidicoccus sp. MSG2]MCY1014651.1 hypothetical protein [Pyxidicoccus sp. MSG2]
MNAIRTAALAAEPPSIVGQWKSTQCEVRPGGNGQKFYVSCSAVFSFNQCPWELDLVKVVGNELFFGARPAEGGCNPDAKHLPSELQVPLKRVK